MEIVTTDSGIVLNCRSYVTFRTPKDEIQITAVVTHFIFREYYTDENDGVDHKVWWKAAWIVNGLVMEY